jgi:hypothetical protein
MPDLIGAMTGFDMNWWGMYAMPIGVALCFGPVLIAWARAERREKTPQEKPKDRR